MGLGGASLGLAALLAAMAVLHDSRAGLIACVVVAGALLGISNTLMTQVVMECAPVERPVASAAYSFVRFCVGADRAVHRRQARRGREASPFVPGAGVMAIATAVLWFHRDSLVPADVAARRPMNGARPQPRAPEPATTALAHTAAAPMVVAVAGETAREVGAMAVPIARSRGAAVHVLDVAERDVVAGMDDAADLETPDRAEALLGSLDRRAREARVPVGGEVLRAVGAHADAADAILRHAGRLGAGLIVIGPGRGRTRLHPTITGRIAAGAPSHVIVLDPRAGALGRPHAPAGTGDAAALWRAGRT